MQLEVGLIIAAIAGIAIPLMIQTAAIVWWASQMAARVRQLEGQLARDAETKHPERLMRLETYVEIIQKQQDEQMMLLREIQHTLQGKGKE